MKRVTGIGGIFFQAKDPVALREWYRRHLGVPVEEWGGAAFSWGGAGTTNWSVGEIGNEYYKDSAARFMVNYRVADLHALVAALREEGCNVDEKVDESD